MSVVGKTWSSRPLELLLLLGGSGDLVRRLIMGITRVIT